MKFGVSLPDIHPIGTAGWDDAAVVEGIIQVAQAADRLGYEFVTCCDHAVIPKEATPFMGERWFDAIATLSYAAGLTRRVKLLPSVMIVPYRTPFDLAKSMATLDALSNGRLVLGIGVGHLEREFRALKANFEERGPVTDEYIRIIKALWSNDAASYEGTYWRFKDLMIAPRPVQRPHPPIWVGGNTYRAVRRAVELGEAWHPFQVTAEEYRRKVQFALEHARKIGRTTPLEFDAPLGPIQPGARDRLPRRAAPQYAPEASGQKEPAYVKDTTAPRMAASLTTADEVAAAIQAYRDAGATTFNLRFRYEKLPQLLESMDWFAQEIMAAHA